MKNNMTNLHNTTMMRLDPLFETENCIFLDAQQIRNNQDLFSGHDINDFKLKEDGRNVCLGINIAEKVACPAPTLINMLAFSINDLSNQCLKLYENTECKDANKAVQIYKLILKMVSANYRLSDLVSFYGHEPKEFALEEFKKTNPLLVYLLQDEKAYVSMLEDALAKQESGYPKTAGVTRLVDKDINNAFLDNLLEFSKNNILNGMWKVIMSTPGKAIHIQNKIHAESQIVMVNLIIISHLRCMKRKRAIKFILRSAPFLNKDLVEVFYDSLTLKNDL